MNPTLAENDRVDWRPVFAAEADFILRRIADLRRDGHTRDARALRRLLPERYTWREWTGTLTDRDRRRIAKAEANAAAFDATIRTGEIPDPKNTDLGDMIMACLEADMRRAAACEQGAQTAEM